MRRVLATAAVLAVGFTVGTVASTSAAPQLAPTAAVRFPSGYPGQIYVGENKVWPTTPATTVRPTTTTATTVAPTTTESASTTSAPAATTTTPDPTTTAPISTTSPGASGCGLPAAAFCETFSQAYPDDVSRTGDLDEALWGVSRTHNQGNTNPGARFQWYTPKGYTSQYGSVSPYIQACNIGFAPNDVRVCHGRLIEAVQDAGNDSKTTLAMYPKQPFNWAGRTGTVVFDVSTDTNGPHAAWPELWITNLPTPAPGADGHGQPKEGFGINMSGNSGCATAPSQMNVVHDNAVQEVWPTLPQGFRCVATSAADSPNLNHVRITVAHDKVELWMTEPGGTVEYLMGTYNGVNLGLEQGLVWLNDGHYNACKDGAAQCDHAIAWDNLGFDGPKTYRDLSFDALDNHVPAIPSAFGDGDPGFALGWAANDNPTITVHGVHLGDKTPTAAYVVFNSYTVGGHVVPSVSINGNTPISVPWVYGDEGYTIHSIAIPVPLSQIKTDGTPNTLQFAATDNANIANINIVLVNAQTVPGG